MKDPRDELLENIVRDWAKSQPVEVSVALATKGGSRLVRIEPKNVQAVSVSLWVADDGAHAACSIGGGSWWDRAVSLERDSIVELLSAVADGKAWEEVRRLGVHIVGRRGYIELPSRRLTYGQFFGVPGIEWQEESHQPY